MIRLNLKMEGREREIEKVNVGWFVDLFCNVEMEISEKGGEKGRNGLNIYIMVMMGIGEIVVDFSKKIKPRFCNLIRKRTGSFDASAS